LPGKILVTSQRGGSRVALIGPSGKQLLSSELFTEPRAKGATVRALKGLLGSKVTVEDNTVSAKTTAVSKRGLNGKTPPTRRARGLKASSATKSPNKSTSKRSASTGGSQPLDAGTSGVITGTRPARRRPRKS
jgi:hypothetical protein